MMTDTTARPDPGAAEKPEAASDTTQQAPDPIAQLQQEAAEWKDRVLRTLAEMENLRRRTEREVADARAYGVANFARDVLVVSDNMSRALQSVAADLRASTDPGIKALIDGLEMTEREVLKTLEKHGVRKFDPLGEKFDPNLHQAMYEIPNDSMPSGSVAQVVQSGFMIGDRVLRPAMVGVTKSAAKAAATPANDDQPLS
jgi:molecular chaperone GrpE